MNILKSAILPVLLATIWISISEFVRNEYLVKSFWISHYQNMGLIFPSEPVNGTMWGLWSLLFAIIIFVISGKFDFLRTCVLSWVIGFVLMWVVIGNLGMLPFGLLYYAIPLSMLEVVVAAVIIFKLKGNSFKVGR
jgi:hypothetical protein